MPMIDVYAAAGTFADHAPARGRLATAVMDIEQLPDIRCSAEPAARARAAAQPSKVDGEQLVTSGSGPDHAARGPRQQLAVSSG